MSGAMAQMLVATMPAGAVTAPALTAAGLRQLRSPVPRQSLGWAAVAGIASGAAAALAASHATGWSSVPALAVWAVCLTSSAACDVATQRIPTGITRVATVISACLFGGTSAIEADGRRLLIAALAGAVLPIILLAAWRWAGVGFGDVRLGALGGLGVGWCGFSGWPVGLGAFYLVLLSQVVLARSHNGSWRGYAALGPAIAAVCLVTAATG